MNYESNRREFLKTAAKAGASLALASAGGNLIFGEESADEDRKYGISMVALPYDENALEPYISEKTVKLHYFKHHRDYYTILKGWIYSHTQYQYQTVEELIQAAHDGTRFDESVFEIAVLLFNHNSYWPSLSPTGGGVPTGRIGSMIENSFGSYATFRTAFTKEAMKTGIGYLWLVEDGGKLKVSRTEYHDTPLLKGHRPLLAVDMWEHAYYLDYQNDRRAYVDAVLDHLLNWDHAEKALPNEISKG